MAAYKGRVALVTGASSGIGAAIAETLVKEGVIVVGAARRVERIQALSDSLEGEPGRLIAKQLDMSNMNEIKEIFRTIEEEVGGVDILINNAAVGNPKPIQNYQLEELKFLIDVNQISCIVAASEAINGWIRRDVNDGFIVNVNSVTGHKFSPLPVTYGIYPSTKWAMTAFSELLRQDLQKAGLKARVTNLSPGLVSTEMTTEIINSGSAGDNFLCANDIANAVSFVLNLPTNTEISQLSIRPTNELF